MIDGKDIQQQFHDCMPLFIALGDEVRLSIVEALTGQRGMNVKEITEKTNLSRPAISHHLKILKDAGLVRAYKEGTSNYYYLTVKDGTRQLMTLGAGLQKFLDLQDQ